MNTQLKVLVYGGTGSQGSAVVTALLNQGHIPHVLTRDANKVKAQQLAKAGAHLVAGDMTDRARLTELSQNVDAVSLMIPFGLEDPTVAPQIAINAIDAAKATNVKLIIYNTSGPMPPQETGDPGADLRLMMHNYLAQSGVPYITIAPTVYLENLLGPWTAPYVIQENKLAYPNPASLKLGWVASADVGKLIVAALESPELAGSIFRVSGLRNVDGHELAQEFSKGLERNVDYYFLPLTHFAKILNDLFGPGTGDAAAEFYGQMHKAPVKPPMWFDMQPILQKLPIEMTSIEAWARQHAELFLTTPLLMAQ